MKNQTAFFLIAFFGLAAAAPVPQQPAYVLRGREVPQEHSHNSFLASVRKSLQLNNPNQIVDPVFGLLGSAAAASGKGKISDVDCLHLATADQAFTNAKAAKDISGMTDALIYAALERNTGSVGLASVLCKSIKAVNKEIGAISQHQDPASPNAAAINKAIVLELAKQISSIGGDPQLALKSGTFKPGNLGDKTAKGNTCDTENDTEGCIFTLNLLVEDATPAEIKAAVSGVKTSLPGACPAVSARSEDDDDDAYDEYDEDDYDEFDDSVEFDLDERSDESEAYVFERSVGSSCSAPASALDLGSCSDPTIKFAFGLDGRNTAAFAPKNPKSFNHGSALNIGVISSFICGQLSSACKASAAAIADCAAGEAAASKLTGQAAADAFNAAFGASSPAAPASASAPPVVSAAGTNVQTFTGALGGLPPPVIQSNSERPFSVNGSTFLNKSAAIQRSCAVQHNACANAANSGALKGGVDQCETQESACNAAGGV